MEDLDATGNLNTYSGRFETFKKFGWPHSDLESCNREKMADAGFFMVESDENEDLARCFYCLRELDGWEADDDPWQEHKRRPCPFIKKGKLARNLTVKDQIELEAERFKIVTRQRIDKELENMKAKANQTKLELMKLASARRK